MAIVHEIDGAQQAQFGRITDFRGDTLASLGMRQASLSGHTERKRTIYGQDTTALMRLGARGNGSPEPKMEVNRFGILLPVSQERIVTPEEAVSPEYISGVIERYRKFHNLRNGEGGGARLGHNLLTNGIYSKHNLPVLATIFNWAMEHGDKRIQGESAAAFYSLDQALSFLEEHTSPNGVSRSGAFSKMKAEAFRGDMRSPIFMGAMNTANDVAANCIDLFRSRIDPAAPLSMKNGPQLFGEAAELALREHRESKEGINLGVEFARRLRDPHTKALVISLDINSTLNIGESHSNLFMLDATMEQLDTVIDAFRSRYGDGRSESPEKELLVVINTGRGPQYAWGVLEMLPSMPAFRKLGLAESGGVRMRLEGSKLDYEVAVDNPQEWQRQLKGLEDHIAGQIEGWSSANIEPKVSMMSIRIADRVEEGGKMLLMTRDHESVTPEWVAAQTKKYLDLRQGSLESQLQRFREQLHQSERAEQVANAIERLGKPGKDGKLSGLSDLEEGAAEVIRDIANEVEGISVAQLDQLAASLKTIQEMQDKLEAKYNPTAGYVDIGHSDSNKYSTQRSALEDMGYRPDEVLMVHIGDSSTDIMPEVQTGPGEINEGADKVFLVAVQNSSKGMQDAVARRGQHGYLAARDSVLAVHDVLKGIEREIEKQNDDPVHDSINGEGSVVFEGAAFVTKESLLYVPRSFGRVND